MNVYNNLNLVHDAIQDRDIDILAPTYLDACKYEEFLSKLSTQINKYHKDHNIVIDFKNKKEYYAKVPQRKI